MKHANKINTLYLPVYAMELSRIYFKNGSSIKILDYIKKSSMPMDLQQAILNQNFKDVLRLIRKYIKTDNFKKYVSISYTCDVFSSVSNSWHHINNDLARGCYTSVDQIKTIIQNKKEKNNNENIKNLKFNLKFSF